MTHWNIKSQPAKQQLEQVYTHYSIELNDYYVRIESHGKRAATFGMYMYERFVRLSVGGMQRWRNERVYKCVSKEFGMNVLQLVVAQVQVLDEIERLE